MGAFARTRSFLDCARNERVFALRADLSWTAVTRALVLVLALTATALAEPPPVTRVVVHPDAAIVTRSAAVACGQGPTTVAFHGLPPALDPASLRASVDQASARIQGLSIVPHEALKASSAALAELDDKIADLNGQREELAARARRAQEDAARATLLRSSSEAFIEREAAIEKKPDLTQWALALDQSMSAMTAADLVREQTRTADRKLARKLADLERQRAQLAGAAPAKTWDADVVVRCEGQATVELSYLTSAARWTPAYEARADAAKKSIRFSVLARVEQGTGEDWSNVDVTLSTALAQRDSRPPKPMRLYVSTYEQPEEKKVLVTRQEAVEHAEGSTTTAVAGKNAQASSQGLSVRLHVPAKASIAGDGEAARLTIDAFGLPATFDLVSYPKALPVVFRRATVVNEASYPLLAGPLDIFDQHGFLGTTALSRTARGAKIKLALGIDENVQVHRVVLEEEKKSPGFLSSTRKLLYGYRFQLANAASKPVALEVCDQIPVSELNDVKVDLGEGTTAGYRLAKDDGMLTWNVRLKPGEKKNVDLRFTVEIPSKYDASAL